MQPHARQVRPQALLQASLHLRFQRLPAARAVDLGIQIFPRLAGGRRSRGRRALEEPLDGLVAVRLLQRQQHGRSRGRVTAPARGSAAQRRRRKGTRRRSRRQVQNAVDDVRPLRVNRGWTNVVFRDLFFRARTLAVTGHRQYLLLCRPIRAEVRCRPHDPCVDPGLHQPISIVTMQSWRPGIPVGETAPSLHGDIVRVRGHRDRRLLPVGRRCPDGDRPGRHAAQRKPS